ncbi:MAG TPA: FUSC family protein [Chthoniobacterales bacterium]
MSRWWRLVFPPTPRAFRRTAMESGIRAALAIGLPISLGFFSGHLAVGVLAGLGAHFVLLADLGGAYVQKACAMVGSLVGITVMVAATAVCREHVWTAVLGTAGAVFFAGIAAMFGPVTSMVGFSCGLVFVVDVGAVRGDLPVPEPLLWLIGGCWSLLLSLALWQLRPNQPLREALATCYQTAGQILETVHSRLRTATEPSSGVLTVLQRLTQEILTARSVWESTRPKNRALSQRESRLLLLVENADQLSSTLAALTELLDRFPLLSDHTSSVAVNVKDLLSLAGQELRELSLSLARRQQAAASSTHLQLRAFLNDGVKFFPINEFSRDEARAATLLLSQLLTKLLQTVLESTELANGTTNAWFEEGATQPAGQPSRGRFREGLREKFDPRSAGFRHAVRWCVATATAQALGFFLPTSNAYWIAMTVYIILRPDFGTTVARAIARMAGTVIGVGFALALVLLTRHVAWNLGFVVLLAYLSYYVRNKSYAAFTAVVTPLILLLINLSRPGDLGVIYNRLIDTAIGGALAFLAARFLLPSWESGRVLPVLGRAVRATARYFALVTEPALGARIDSALIREARRLAGIQNANAGAAVQRALGEPERRGRSGGPAGSTVGDASRPFHLVGEADQALVEYLNWLLRVATGLHEHLAGRNVQVLDSMGELRTRVIRELDAVADQLERGQTDDVPAQAFNLDAELGSMPEAAFRTGEASVVRAFLRRTWQLTEALRLTCDRMLGGGQSANVADVQVAGAKGV